MKKLKFLPFILLLALSLSLWVSPAALALEDPALASRAAVVLDLNTGEDFYTLNADQRVYPASTTKIMTVLLALEAIESGRISIYDPITASANMTYDLVSDGSSAGIQVGETMTLENLLYCAMISSANEACNIIAEAISGTVSDFIAAMNARAAELGCVSTQFRNTHGLPDPEHYTTAADFCLIAREAASHELFMTICSTPTVTIPATNMAGERQLKNSNALICAEGIYGSHYLYAPASGMKTGFTSDAGYCLVSTASNGSIDLLAAVFGGHSYTDAQGRTSYTNFEDSIALYEWVFNNFSYQEILRSAETITAVPVSMGDNADAVSLRPGASITALLPRDFDPATVEKTVTVNYAAPGDVSLAAPIAAGEVLGSVTVSINGVSYGSADLIAAGSVELSRIQYMKTQIGATLRSKPVVITFWVLVALMAIYLFLVIRYRIIHARRRRAVRAARAEQARRAAAGQQRQAAQERAQQRSSAPAIIRYFSAEEQGSAANTAPPPDTQESQQAKAERDYFEEFFKQK